jgi:hypothetical protein
VAIVDDEDFDWLMRWKWFAVRGRGGTFYAMRTVNVTRRDKYRVPMHRQLLGAPEAFLVDHRNGDGLDNQKQNLRLCRDEQNCWNRVGHPNASSRFKGVGLHKATGKWAAYIRVGGKQLHIGLFDDEEAAASAYDRIAREHHGEFARLNFPEEAA